MGPVSGGEFRVRNLSDNEIHVWATDLAKCADRSLLDRYARMLSPSEAAANGRFVFEKDRHRDLVTRALIRFAIGTYLGCTPSSLDFERDNLGKPRLVRSGGASQTLDFNASHSNSVVVAAFAWRGQVGVDVEADYADAPYDVAQSCFAPDEVKVIRLRRLEPNDRRAQFWAIWTLKEAYTKATGQGARTALDSFAFDLDREGSVLYRALEEPISAVGRRRPWFAQWHPAPGYIAAIWVEDHRRVLQVTQIDCVPSIYARPSSPKLLRVSPRQGQHGSERAPNAAFMSTSPLRRS